jgi:hypothetical protein
MAVRRRAQICRPFEEDSNDVETRMFYTRRQLAELLREAGVDAL